MQSRPPLFQRTGDNYIVIIQGVFHRKRLPIAYSTFAKTTKYSFALDLQSTVQAAEKRKYERFNDLEDSTTFHSIVITKYERFNDFEDSTTFGLTVITFFCLEFYSTT